jgi:flagellar basal-body rod protein FlgC
MVDLVNSMFIASSGMKAQSDRLRIVAQNIANVDTTGSNPNEAPYRRKVVSFENELNRELDADMVKVSDYGVDKSAFPRKYDPSHPAADEAGYIQTPNVNMMIEMVDMREARRAYEANINMVEVSKNLLLQTINILKS